jgi:glycogen(starch) synthase
MKILLCSYAFAPSIGGIESSSLCFANGMVERGHDVTVVTATSATCMDEFPFELLRCPTSSQYAGVWRQADIVWHNNISLRLAWPLIVFPRPFVITHQTWVDSQGGVGRSISYIKNYVSVGASNVFNSNALRERSGLSGEVVPNPYDDRLFKLYPDVTRDRDIAFVGRLIPDKGAHVLIDAIANLAARSIFAKATIIGDGPEMGNLKLQAARSGVGDAITFPGVKRGLDLVLELNRHSVLAVPSLWDEPFGIVALEGAACGCFVIGTQRGGLPEAIGPSGCAVENGDAVLFADALYRFLSDPKGAAPSRSLVDGHLAQFTMARIVQRYEDILSDMAGYG